MGGGAGAAIHVHVAPVHDSPFGDDRLERLAVPIPRNPVHSCPAVLVSFVQIFLRGSLQNGYVAVLRGLVNGSGHRSRAHNGTALVGLCERVISSALPWKE